MNNPNAAANLTAPRFKPGQSGNPSGKSSAHLQAEKRAAEIAARLRLRMLEELDGDPTILDRLDAATLKLFKDSEDRAHGTPTQSVDVTTAGEPVNRIVNEIHHASHASDTDSSGL